MSALVLVALMFSCDADSVALCSSIDAAFAFSKARILLSMLLDVPIGVSGVVVLNSSVDAFVILEVLWLVIRLRLLLKLDVEFLVK
mmetsp:Transcript_31558/g.66038  ORF Transcript_31558/g.66038 Transcript_31558/m.66038 type:complete len:86 (+) Transcript_31558:244-501(+)